MHIWKVYLQNEVKRTVTKTSLNHKEKVTVRLRKQCLRRKPEKIQLFKTTNYYKE